MASECPFLSIVLSEHLKGRLLHRGHPARAEMNPSIHHLCLQYLQDTCPHCISSNCWEFGIHRARPHPKTTQNQVKLTDFSLSYHQGPKRKRKSRHWALAGHQDFLHEDFKICSISSRFQGFKVSRFQDFSWIFFLGSGKMSPFFVSLLCIYLETCYLSAESTRHFPPDKSLGKCFVRQQQLLEEYLREV